LRLLSAATPACIIKMQMIVMFVYCERCTDAYDGQV
jgi:hypothetical protein